MSDTLETVICPKCGCEMKKVFLEDQGFNVDICLDGYGGILFDNREFKKVDENHENIKEILKAYEGKEYKETDIQEQLKCPVCGGLMVKNNSAYKSDFKIDECYLCGAKFLDYGELNKIRTINEDQESNMAEIENVIKLFAKLENKEND